MERIPKILLIDDDVATNFHNKLLLMEGRISTNVKGFLDAQEALDFLEDEQNRTPDLILLDLNMPEMSGMEFLDALKKIDLDKKPLVVVLTGSEDPREKEELLNHPSVDLFRKKPMTEEMVHEIILSHFDDEDE